MSWATANALLSAVAAVYLVLRMAVWIHGAQLESYQVGGFAKHHLVLCLRPPDVWMWAVAAAAVVMYALNWSAWIGIVLALAVLSNGCVAWIERRRKTFKAKPLRWTARAVRLAVVWWAICIAELLAVRLLWPPLALTVAALAGLNTVLALLVARPVELAIAARFKRQANLRIRQLKQTSHLRVVGITGSFGKTSTKFILGTLLGVRHGVLVTPSSFNTPMGVCTVINSQLAAHHELFVCEMGARHRGDIRELVRFVEPDAAMITAVGPAHLDTFGTVATIARTKFDIARDIPAAGPVVVNGDSEWCRREAQTLGRPVLFYGVDESPGLSAYAKDISVVGTQSDFTLVFPGDGEVACRTRLLGRHNILNIVGAALMARRLGLSLPDIGVGVANVEPVEHRLQLVDPGTGILVIDDAFNSNPEGARIALEVLDQFTDRRRWVITPGMVEMGKEAHDLHMEFGRQMAKVCHQVVLVGRRNAPSMLAGLEAEGFPATSIAVTGSLQEAMTVFAKKSRSGDVVLFENDLPDHLEDGG